MATEIERSIPNLLTQNQAPIEADANPKPEIRRIVQISTLEKQLVELRAHGFQYPEMAQLFSTTEAVLKYNFLKLRKKTRSNNETSAIIKLVDTRIVPLEKLQSQFDYSQYESLTPRMQQILQAVYDSSTWDKKLPEIAENLGIKTQSLKNNLELIYAGLDTANLLQARIFMYFLEKNKSQVSPSKFQA